MERLHYDSSITRIDKENDIGFFGITFDVIKIFFYFFIFFAIIKFLFGLDSISMLLILKPIIKILPLIFKLTIFADVSLMVIFYFVIKNREIRKLNMRFGLSSN